MPAPDPADVLAAVGLPPPSEVDRADSTDALVWRVRVDGRDLALRLYRLGARPLRERRAAELAAAAGVPVPAPVTSGWFDRRAVDVSTWCPGRPVAAVMAAALAAGDAEAAAGVCRRFGRTQALLHAATVPTGEPLADVAALLDRAGCDHALRAKLATAVDAGARGLLHMDYHPFNVLDDGHAVTGVVDWTNAAVGDPRFDLARTRSLFVLADELRPQFAALVPDLLAHWRVGYEQVKPMPGDDELAPFLACAGGLLLADWRPRVRAGEAPRRLLDVAGAWARHWRVRAVDGMPAPTRTEPAPTRPEPAP